MFARIAVAAATLVAASSAFAHDVTVADVSHQTGIKERYIRMVAGARTPYPEYLIVYDRVERELKEKLGEQGFHQLQHGQFADALRSQREHMAEMALASRGRADQAKATPDGG